MNTIPLAPPTLTHKTLAEENRRYTGRGGISEENRGLGFLPAYRDSATGSIHLSRFADGRRAPIHLLDGLPEPLVLGRETSKLRPEIVPDGSENANTPSADHGDAPPPSVLARMSLARCSNGCSISILNSVHSEIIRFTAHN